MTGTWALIPAKSPDRSKTRLGGVMQQDESALFSLAMLRDVLESVSQAEYVDVVAVLTDSDDIADRVKRAGHLVIRDESDDLCAALEDAAAYIAMQDADTLLVMPADLPTILPADIDALLAKHAGGLSICPAIRDGGTNAMVCSPPTAVPFCFGKDSARLHLDSAQASGVEARRLALPAFFRDIDLPDDLIWLKNQNAGAHSLAFLRHSGISARLGPGSLSASA